jgi:hypothetical protein
LAGSLWELAELRLFGLLRRDGFAASAAVNPFKGILSEPHFAAKAKRIIYLFMAGGPSQLDFVRLQTVAQPT